MKLKLVIFALFFSLLSMMSALAHHSYAAFDNTKKVTVVMTVSKFEWTNPHAWLRGTIADEQGAPKEYALELRSIAELQRQGLRSIDIKPGDKLTAVINPARDGSSIGTVVTATLASGKKFAVTRAALADENVTGGLGNRPPADGK